MATEIFRLPTTALRRLFHPKSKFRVIDDSNESLLTQRTSHGRKIHPKSSTTPTKVPRGNLAVYVGKERRRYVIPAKFLSSPEFEVLLVGAAEEFGFQLEGGLIFSCEEEEFEELLMRLK